MRIDLVRDLMCALQPFTGDSDQEAVKAAITMAISKYDVTPAETSITVWNGDMNDRILQRFLAAKIAAGLSRRTIKYYKDCVTIVLRKIGKPYDEVTADDVRIYLATRTYQDKVSKCTANNERRCLSAFYGWLQREEILLRNPLAKVDVIKDRKKKKKAFDPMEIERLRVECRTNRETALVELLLSTWCRVSEVSGILISDIRDDRLIVHGKGDKDREVYLNARAILALTRYLGERQDSNPYLFPRSAGDGIQGGIGLRQARENWYKDPRLVHPSEPTGASTIEIIIRHLGRRAGVENTHPHRFRRTGATMALRSGMPLVQVSKLLGHESIATTQIYLDVSDAELSEAHKKYVT